MSHKTRKVPGHQLYNSLHPHGKAIGAHFPYTAKGDDIRGDVLLKRGADSAIGKGKIDLLMISGCHHS